jgi:hypothetical protein
MVVIGMKQTGTCKGNVRMKLLSYTWIPLQGTEYYDAPTRRYVDFPITDVLQVSEEL